MKGHSTVKTILKSLFIILQCLFITLSVILSIFIIILYSKLKEYLDISLKPVIISLFISFLYLVIPLIGLLFILKRRKTFIYLYNVLLIICMNVDLLIVSMEYFIIKNTINYTNERWKKLTNNQKQHIQEKLECCGFFSINDRAVPSSNCGNNGVLSKKKNNSLPCKDVFLGIVEGIRKKLTRSIIILFMIKSLAIAIGFIINNKKKKKKLRVKYNKSSHRLEIK
ncbi:Tetraspanin family integral membrane protein [Pseudoloma neurophilia]|uniref:Tetraspanin family integral membrane protein n=1 Tax=Pseudoloma neurophilia TaxID=146866 RepID=A0A0R0LRG5_9MICR|nr:Tetraspanin family integral membrane protein [Pseudoloma neurophilia]